MSSRPADSWITDLTASLASVSSVPSPSDSASGNTGSTAARFVTLGSRMTQGGSSSRTEGEYDGGAKRAHLFLFEVKAQQDVSRVCLGFVGQDNKRFCLHYASVQDPSSGVWFCGVQHHVVRFEPEDKTFSPRANEIIGFCFPSFPMSIIPAGQLAKIKLEKRTIPEWAWLFKSFLLDTTDEDTSASLKQLGFSVPVSLKTPSKQDAVSDISHLLFFTPDGVKDIVQAYQLGQLGDSSWESMDNIPGLLRDLFAFLKAMNAFILDFENWWKLPLSDYSKLISTIHEDLHALKKSCELISLLVGTLVEIDDLNFPDAWNATAYAAHCFATLPELTAIHDKLMAHQTTIEQML